MLIALALLLLLLLEQFVVPNFLFRIKDGAKLFSGLLQLLADFRLNRLHEFLRALLARSNDFVDLFLLVCCQGQLACNPPQELNSDAPGGDRLNTAISLAMLRPRWSRNGIFYQQPASHYPSAENDDRREYDLPGVHQMESDAC